MGVEQFCYTAVGFGFLLCLLSLFWFRHRPFKGLVSFLLAVSLTATLAVASKDVLSYRQLMKESRIARIFISQKGTQRYLINIDQLNGESPQSYMLAGDEWQLDSRVIKWSSDLARLGLGNSYRLQRISGRYASVDDETSQLRTVYRVEISEQLDIWALLRKYRALWQWVQADYGNAVYAPMVDGAVYEVVIGHSGISLLADNPIASSALYDWSH
ncbi:MAG: cation/multidrug efflux pump [Spongiibacteraceae bacterium]